MSAVLTTTERRRPTTLRSAVRRLFALAPNPSSETSSPLGMFDRAQNTSIQHATFTINQYGGIVPDGGTATARRADPSTAPHQDYENPLSEPRRESPDIYVDRLLTKNRGYPLWIPSPSMSLPVLNRTLGVSLGDVGVLTPEGGFDFLFNIFHDASHAINAVVGVPEGFYPFTQPKGAGNVEYVEWYAGSYLASPSMVRVDNGRDRLKIVLESRVPEAAVLMIPEVIYATRVNITLPLRKYIEENIVAWYKFVKLTLGRDIDNGDLRVVYACRKSSGFGIGTVFNTEQTENTQLTFSWDSTWAEISGCAYRWSHIGSAEVKAGPSRQENSGLNLTEPPRNQCLFISTIDSKVSTKIWKDIEQLVVGTPADGNSQLTSSASRMTGGPSKRTRGEPNTRGTGHIATWHRYHERVFHPSAILHDILETMAPGLPVYMVCDNDWAPFITAKDMDVGHFVRQVFSRKCIAERAGMAYFSENFNTQIPEQVQDCVAKIDLLVMQHDGSGDREYYHWKATRTNLARVKNQEVPKTTRGKHTEHSSLPRQPSNSIESPHSNRRSPNLNAPLPKDKKNSPIIPLSHRPELGARKGPQSKKETEFQSQSPPGRILVRHESELYDDYFEYS